MEMDSKPTEQSQRDALYLESSEGTSHVTLLSLVTIFIQQYCRYRDLDIILVSESEPSSDGCFLVGKSEVQLGAPSHSGAHPDLSHDGIIQQKEASSSCDDLDSDLICSDNAGLDLLEIPKHLEYTVLKADCLPRVVQDCQLPCILLPGRQLCVSGLANVLRHIILSAVPLEPHRNLIALLGFRQTCLKCCSESSVWTKLCEVDTPQQVTNFLKNPSEVSTCLTCLSKFQELLSQPVATFNSEKLRRNLLKKEKNGNDSRRRGDSNEEKKDDATRRPYEEKKEVVGGRENGTEYNSTQKPVDDLGTSSKTSVADSGEELTSEFSQKLHLCNKKEERRRKRKQRKDKVQTSQGLSRNDRTTETNIEQVCLSNGAIDRDEDENGDLVYQPDDRRQRRKKKPRNKKKIHKDSLPELTHLFAQGVDVTLTDFALFVPIHLWLHTSILNGMTQLASRTVPLVMDWYQRMWDVPCVRQVVTTGLGMREVDIAPLMTGSDFDDGDAVKENSKTDSFLSEEDVRPHVGNLKLGRAVVRELLKKVLPGVIQTLEDQELSGGFVDHPSKDTSLNWRNMHPAVSPIEGEVEASRARGKEQQIESIVTAVQKIALPGQRILDFCSGGGHLGIALAYCLPECHVIMIENKEESLRRALGRVQTLGLQNVSLYLSNIDYFYGQFDIGVSLHACGVATDIVLSKCLEQKASFVSSPCCYGSIHNTHHISYPRSQIFKKSSISKKEYFLVGRGADQTCWDFESHLAKQGKQCMGYIDRDRAEFAREHGYDVTLCSLKPETCSPKNNLLIGVSPHRQGIKK